MPEETIQQHVGDEATFHPAWSLSLQQVSDTAILAETPCLVFGREGWRVARWCEADSIWLDLYSEEELFYQPEIAFVLPESPREAT